MLFDNELLASAGFAWAGDELIEACFCGEECQAIFIDTGDGESVFTNVRGESAQVI